MGFWLLILAVLLTTPRLSAAQYTFQTFDVTLPNTHTTEVTGVGADGTITATYRGVGNQPHGVIKTCLGAVMPQYTLVPRASNPAGFIGWYLGPSGHRTAFLAQAGTFTALEGPRDAQHRRTLGSDGLHVNSLGVGVGSYQSADGITHGWRWDPNGPTFITIDVPDTSATELIHIAEDGRMLARALGLDNVLRYYLWESGTWTLLTLPSLPNVELVARTASGVLLGNTDTSGFRWDGTTVEPIAVAGATQTQLLGSQGPILFGRYLGADTQVHGFLAVPTGTSDPCAADPPEGGGAREKQGREHTRPR